MVALTTPRLRVLITLARLQDFKGWDWVHPTDIPQGMPCNLARGYSACQAITDLESLRSLGLVKRRRAKERIAIDRNGKHEVVQHEYALTIKGDELASMLFEEGLPRWIDR